MRHFITAVQTFVLSFNRTKNQSTMNHELMYAYTNRNR